MRLLRRLLNPDKKILLIFSLPIGLVSFYVNYVSAFSFIGIITYLFFLALFGFSCLALIIDNLFKTRLIKYSAIFLIMFPIGYYIFQPLIPWIKRSSEQRGQILAKAIENYKVKHGVYPLSVNDSDLKDAPKHVFIFRSLYYRTYVDENKKALFRNKLLALTV